MPPDNRELQEIECPASSQFGYQLRATGFKAVLPLQWLLGLVYRIWASAERPVSKVSNIQLEKSVCNRLLLVLACLHLKSIDAGNDSIFTAISNGLKTYHRIPKHFPNLPSGTPE